MKQYYVLNNRVIFYEKDKTRKKTFRKRCSSRWVKNPKHRLPFRIENYYGPTQFYGGILNHRIKCETGKLVVSRGIWRNIHSLE